jgi:hypothetical protein
MSDFVLKRGSTELTTDISTPFTETITDLGTTVTFTASCKYAANLDKGIDSGGNLSASVSYAVAWKAFYGKINKRPENSTDIRSLPSSLLNPANGTQLTINLAAGDEGFCFAYPSTLRDATKIEQDDSLPMLGKFSESDAEGNPYKLTITNIEGLTSTYKTTYKVYWLIPDKPYGEPTKYVLTI